jgi:hypothetical protein
MKELTKIEEKSQDMYDSWGTGMDLKWSSPEHKSEGTSAKLPRIKTKNRR